MANYNGWENDAPWYSYGSEIINIIIEDGVTSIGAFAFADCSGLTSVTIPNSVTNIVHHAFSRCNSLTSITIPNSVTSIGDYAFFNCDGMTSITIPNSVTSIGEEAFWACRGLTSITIPSSVTSIGERAFMDCKDLTSIVVESGNTNYDSRENCNAIIETASNTLVLGCMNSFIPSTVTRIEENAFSDCDRLTSITIPGSVTNIGEHAFWACRGLTSIVVESGNTNYDSRENCNAIIETASNTLIQGCMNSFIPSTVTTIGQSAFNACFGLTSITIPESVTNIGDDAFDSCRGLTSITIPNSVTSIGDYAFWDCRGLTSVTIGNSVTSIGEVAFAGCSGLTDFNCFAENVPDTQIYAFASSNIENATLHVPAPSINKYSNTEPWKNFKEIVALTDQELSIGGVSKDNIPVGARYTIGGQRTNKNTKGLNIVHMSDGTMKKVVIK